MRDSRFTNSKAGMLFSVEENDANAVLAQESTQHGTRETIAEIATSKSCFVSCITMAYWRLLMLNQRSSPGEASTIGREQNEVTIFDTTRL